MGVDRTHGANGNRRCHGSHELPESRCRIHGGRSRRVTEVVAQDPTEPLPAVDIADSVPNFVTRFDDLVPEPLVIPFAVMMFEISQN